MIHKHKFITFDKFTGKYKFSIYKKKFKENGFLFTKRFDTLEDAIKERDLFLSKYQDKRYKGVSYHKNRNKWISNITLKGKQIHLGSHETQEEAKEFRNKILKDLMN